ncbi:MAG TPA: methyltransferase [Planctomycetaceae bacterium]|nr:methyltransferase [Planctomycetaceae bacterium]
MPRRNHPASRRSQRSSIPPAEELLIEAIPELEAERALCTSVGRGQFAAELSQHLPQARVVCHFFDIFHADQAREAVPESVDVVCSADLPSDEIDLAAIPVQAKSEAELTRDVLQSAHQALRMGGRMIVAIDTEKDYALHQELRGMFAKVTRRPSKRGVLYLATKTAPLKKVKNFEARFAFRDQGRLIWCISRPGIFSHRELDGGARALMHIMPVEPGMRVLDIGCGSGAVAMAAAFRADNVQVLAVDSNSRAVDCTRRGAELNELTRIETLVNASGEYGQDRQFDLVLGNPPYFSNYRIAGIFLEAAERALKRGGEVLMVTKTPNWFVEHMSERFNDVRVDETTNYWVVRGRR